VQSADYSKRLSLFTAHYLLRNRVIIIIMVITDLYSAFRSEDIEALKDTEAPDAPEAMPREECSRISISSQPQQNKEKGCHWLPQQCQQSQRTRSSAVAERPSDDSCLSVVSFNIPTVQFFITSYCGFRFTSA